MDRQTVKVYVRAGAHEGERTISFRPPAAVVQPEWLKRGFAIDGNSVIASVTPATYVGYDNPDVPPPPSLLGRVSRIGSPEHGELCEGDDSQATLVQALENVETWLVEWLDTLGYDVEFA